MKSIQKLKVSNALLSTGVALTLMITACSKKDQVVPLANVAEAASAMQVSAVSERPSTVKIRVEGLDDQQHLNRHFEYRRVQTAMGGGGGGGWRGRGGLDWKDDLNELVFDALQQKFIQTDIYPQNGFTTIVGEFPDGDYQFRIAYQVPGDNETWFTTSSSVPVQIKGKPAQSSPQSGGGRRKSMSIQPDLNAAKAFPVWERGVVVLNFTDLNNIDLNDIGRAIIKSRVSPAPPEKDYQTIAASSSIRILCDYVNNKLLIKGLANGVTYDFKINFDGVEVEVKNVVASGVSIVPSLN